MTKFKQMTAVTPKRKNFTIEYEDGTREVIKEGLLFGLKSMDEKSVTMVAKACGIRSEDKAYQYFHMLAQFMMQLCEDDEKLDAFLKSFYQEV